MDRQPSSSVSSLAGQVQGGIDQMTQIILNVVGEDPQADADLGGGEPGARCVEHRLGELLDQLA